MKFLARVAVLPLVALSVSAAPPAQTIPLGKYGEAIAVPVDSPVKFRRFNQYDRAEFTGRFVPEGTFVLEGRSSAQAKRWRPTTSKDGWH